MIILVVSNANNIGFVCALSYNALQTPFVIILESSKFMHVEGAQRRRWEWPTKPYDGRQID